MARKLAMKETLYRVIESSAAVAADWQLRDGAMPPGHNGPYRDPETPVRNTGHWLLTFLKAYDISGDRRFLKSGRRAALYLRGTDSRPRRATFLHRLNPSKDSCNGLIGQAWTLEALAAAAGPLGMSEMADLGQEVFLLHPFDPDVGLWHSVEVDGRTLGFDTTFNHQLWFAAAGSLLESSRGDEVGRRVARFMDLMPENLAQHPSGLIRHGVGRKLPRVGRRSMKGRVAALMGRGSRSGGEATRHHKALGYHAFNLYALAILARRHPEHDIWRDEPVRSALHYVDTEEYLAGIEANEFGFPYNPPGFEVAMALHVFENEYARDVRPEMAGWVSRQLARCYDLDKGAMTRGTGDPATQSARLYEATRLPDLVLNLEAVRDGGEREAAFETATRDGRLP